MHRGVAAEARAAPDAEELVPARVEIGSGDGHDRGDGNGGENAAHVKSSPGLRYACDAAESISGLSRFCGVFMGTQTAGAIGRRARAIADARAARCRPAAERSRSRCCEWRD